MSNHAPHTVERRCDVAIVGGSAAGLAAALQLGRQRRSVIVIDGGQPRNAPAAHMHGYLSREGASPAELTTIAREEVRSYGAEVLHGEVHRVTRTDDNMFHVELEAGHSIIARRVLAATGLIDILPAVDGLAEHWGRDVIHCPFCHGFETRDKRIVQVLTHPMGLHTAGLFRQLSDRLTIVLHGAPDASADGGPAVDADDPDLRALQAAGVRVVHGPVQRIVNAADGHIAAVELADNSRIDTDTVVVTPRFSVRAQPFEPLGLVTAAHPSGLGDIIETDPTGATAVPGLYAAGNVTDPGQTVPVAAANGNRTGGVISASLAYDDIGAAARPSANEADWDHRYGDTPMWSGNPNGSLVREATGLTPGRALDVGAGEGGDALWLAEQGWTVTANDISQRALDRLAAEAAQRGLSVECLRADANTLDAFSADEPGSNDLGDHVFDLVSAQYASIPRSPDGRGVHNMLRAVAPGGTLLVVSHDPEAMRATGDTSGHGRPFDPDAYLQVDDFAAVLADSPDWKVEVHERRPRPPGAASDAHHVDDIVLRAVSVP